MILDALIQRNSIGDKLIQETFSSFKSNNYVLLDDKKTENVQILDIVNFEDACLKLMSQNIAKSIQQKETSMQEVQKLDVSNFMRLKQSNGKETPKEYINKLYEHMQKFIQDLLTKGKKDTSLERFKVDLYTNSMEDRREFKKKLRLLYFKKHISSGGKNKTIKVKVGDETKKYLARRISNVDDNGSFTVEMNNNKNLRFNLKNVIIADTDLQIFARAYINEDILVKKLQHDDILLADVDYETRESQKVNEYNKFFEDVKFLKKSIRLKEIFHLFCGIENINGEIEINGILYYLQILYNLVHRERQKICDVHEGCQCVVIKQNGEKDNKKYKDTFYTVEQIINANSNPLCLLRNSKGDVVRDADGSATYVEIEKLVNLNNTTSQPYQTVAPNRNRNTLQAFSFKYSSNTKQK